MSKIDPRELRFYCAICIVVILAIFLIGCEKDDDLEVCICTQYTSVPGKTPQPWIIKHVGCTEKTKGVDEEGRNFYIDCTSNPDAKPIP